jgi:hypothetical protein
MAANGRESAGQSWEIYGDPTPNPADTETTVVYLLRRAAVLGRYERAPFADSAKSAAPTGLAPRRR